MSTLIKYGPVETILEKDAEGYAFTCPLCHRLFFSSGTVVISQRVLLAHLHDHHKMSPTRAEISETNLPSPHSKPLKLKTAS